MSAYDIYNLILGAICGLLLYLIIDNFKTIRTLKSFIQMHCDPEEVVNKDTTYIKDLDTIMFQHLGFKCKHIVDSNGNLYTRSDKSELHE
jgi:hypothetical protein